MQLHLPYQICKLFRLCQLYRIKYSNLFIITRVCIMNERKITNIFSRFIEYCFHLVLLKKINPGFHSQHFFSFLFSFFSAFSVLRIEIYVKLSYVYQSINYFFSLSANSISAHKLNVNFYIIYFLLITKERECTRILYIILILYTVFKGRWL